MFWIYNNREHSKTHSQFECQDEFKMPKMPLT